MTDKKARNVVIINNIKSDIIDQAIFILKDPLAGKPHAPVTRDIAREAQKIIDDYIRQVNLLKGCDHPRGNSRPKRQRKTAAQVLTVLAFLGVLAFSLVMVMLNAG